MSVLEVTTAKLPKLKSTQAMVDKALKSLNDRNGLSLMAVKKFIACNYDIDVEASSKRIKMCINKNLERGKLGRAFKVPTKNNVTTKPKKASLGATKKEIPTDEVEESDR